MRSWRDANVVWSVEVCPCPVPCFHTNDCPCWEMYIASSVIGFGFHALVKFTPSWETSFWSKQVDPRWTALVWPVRIVSWLSSHCNRMTDRTFFFFKHLKARKGKSRSDFTWSYFFVIICFNLQPSAYIYSKRHWYVGWLPRSREKCAISYTEENIK